MFFYQIQYLFSSSFTPFTFMDDFGTYQDEKVLDESNHFSNQINTIVFIV